MPNEPLRRVDRVVSTYDLTWILDLDRTGKLDLDPSYQRKSVWTARDRKSFMDTIFRNYPSPAIFLHKTIDDESGTTTYHVVDGKQRITTILMFCTNQFRLADDFGDVRFASKRWRDLTDPTIRRLLWNYRVTIEELDDTGLFNINDVFSRLNRNARQLNRQELRHARYDGWLARFLENESQSGIWRTIKVQTLAKERRMMDIQNISELAAIVLRGNVSGFSQDDLDSLYAEYDVIDGEEIDFDEDVFKEEFIRVRSNLEILEDASHIVSTKAQPFYNLYTLWAALFRHPIDSGRVTEFADKYGSFMDAVARAGNLSADRSSAADDPVQLYRIASVGATTDLTQRQDRLRALESALSDDSPATSNES